MEISGINHVNIRCTEGDLPAIEQFYVEVLGFESGERPSFRTAGMWLYRNGRPIVHVSARASADALARNDTHTGSVDHVAFSATGAAELQQRLEHLGVAYQVQNVTGAGYQMFLHDPVGTKLELNFPSEEAPESVAVGTLAPMQQS